RKAEVRSFRNNPTRIVNRVSQALPLNAIQRRYINALLRNFENIVRADTSNLAVYKISFDRIITGTQMKSNANKIFRNELLNRMGYGGLRDNYYPEYFEQIGIKSCVYCNSQLALTVRNVKKEKIAKFQVDHHIPKSEYPCFSISFYNLYPVCGPCNNSKSSNNVNFNLYSDDYSDYRSSKFLFELDKNSLIKYRVNGINAELKIKFNELPGTGFNNTFAIESIYNTQKDIAEELVIKSMIYNKTYTELLKTSLKKLYKNKAPMFERLLAGNYTDEKDIHKRPMAKFTQDIARQLKLIT
ncbi:MAG TPA: hypothetical protein VNX68_12155, partial [Nitrosopumilaceae archaeon]|nr:hypothetical protein [Nitrosopumilaceae archaeon]